MWGSLLSRGVWLWLIRTAISLYNPQDGVRRIAPGWGQGDLKETTNQMKTNQQTKENLTKPAQELAAAILGEDQTNKEHGEVKLHRFVSEVSKTCMNACATCVYENMPAEHLR